MAAKKKSNYQSVSQERNFNKQFESKSERMKFESKIIDWTTFYRRNLHRFVQHYLGLKMHLYEIILLYLMNLFPLIVVVACRASAKSFIIAIFACAKAILYPGSIIVIASSTKKQSSLIVSEKIQKELIPNSPNLAKEIADIRAGQNETEVKFWNTSSIIVVPANDNARGHRATMNIYEEFRMIDKNIIDSVLSPFLVVRQPGYLKKTEYNNLMEEPSEVYISSSWFKSHWVWNFMKTVVKDMYNTKESLLIGFDYAITLKHNIRTKKQLIKERKKMDSMSFDMEYKNLMIGTAENAYYEFDLLNKCQTLKRAFYPRNNIDVVEKKKNKYDIPKKKGEVRILSIDIAMVTNKQGKNDNTVINCLRALPVKDYYERQIPYIEAFNGGNTTEQSIRIKQLFYDFKADYVVLDCQNAGISIADELGKVLIDNDRNCEYDPWTTFNDENTANRIKNPNAVPIIWSVKADASFNHEMHVAMKDVFEKNKIKLLTNSIKAKDYLENNKEYRDNSSENRALFDLPYVQTDLLINEMVNLSYEIKAGKIKLLEPSNGYKDRYVSLAYGNLFIKKMEEDLQGEGSQDNLSELLSYTFFF
ncbi:MAG: terminase [Bacillota bacterium]|nr:terminase [Bacillota bacterium]